MPSPIRRLPPFAVGCAVVALTTALTGPAWADPAPSFRTLLERIGASPSAAEADALLEAAEARVRQARVRPNPTAALEAENAFGSGPFSGYDNAETTLSLTQDLELWGRRGARVEVARGRPERLRCVAIRRSSTPPDGSHSPTPKRKAAERRFALAEEALSLTIADARAALVLVEEGREPMLRGIQAESEAAAARATRDEAQAERDAAFARLTAVAMLPAPVTSIVDSLLDDAPTDGHRSRSRRRPFASPRPNAKRPNGGSPSSARAARCQRQRRRSALRSRGCDSADLRHQHAAAPVRPEPRQYRRGPGRVPRRGRPPGRRAPGGRGRRSGRGRPAERLGEPRRGRRRRRDLIRGSLSPVPDRLRGRPHRNWSCAEPAPPSSPPATPPSTPAWRASAPKSISRACKRAHPSEGSNNAQAAIQQNAAHWRRRRRRPARRRRAVPGSQSRRAAGRRGRGRSRGRGGHAEGEGAEAPKASWRSRPNRSAPPASPWSPSAPAAGQRPGWRDASSPWSMRAPWPPRSAAGSSACSSRRGSPCAPVRPSPHWSAATPRPSAPTPTRRWRRPKPRARPITAIATWPTRAWWPGRRWRPPEPSRSAPRRRRAPPAPGLRRPDRQTLRDG